MAVERSASLEAVAHLRRRLSLIDKIPDGDHVRAPSSASRSRSVRGHAEHEAIRR
jgi:hypothetical protein